jgi:hypothetical protein
MENMAFRILQEYARSGLFNSITLFSNQEIERCIGDIPIKGYYDSLNQTIFSAVHYLNYFTHTDPEIGQVAKAAAYNRIRTIGILDTKNLQEKWFFDLDMERDLCYYLCINSERLEQKEDYIDKSLTCLKRSQQMHLKKYHMQSMKPNIKTLGFALPILTQFNKKKP